MTVGISGCANKLVQPFCLPDRPTLIDITTADKLDLLDANPTATEALAINDQRLKNHIETIEEAAEEHNKQFRAECL